MSTTTMHFGPEWMRAKPQPSPKIHPPPSPPPPGSSTAPASYSALLSPAGPAQAEQRDAAHPFRYSKDALLRIYQDGGGKGGLGLEVERWDGVVREDAAPPIALCDMSDAEKKAFAGPLNSEIRRRQSTDFLPTISTQGLERPRLATSASAAAAGSPHRERFGALMARRRDSTDALPATTPRKLSLTGTQAPMLSPRDPSLQSPRTRMPYSPNFDGVLNGGGSWLSRRRSEAPDTGHAPRDVEPDDKAQVIAEEDENNAAQNPSAAPPQQPNGISAGSNSLADGVAQMSFGNNGDGNAPPGIPPGLDLATVEWSYVDPQQNVQGPFQAAVMQKWFEGQYFTDDLLMKRTHIDTDWISVGELKRRAAGDKIFMSPINPPAAPPGVPPHDPRGLTRHDSPMAIPDSTSFNHSPFQPAPVRQLRAGALDPYIGAGSTPSDSPSSSLGARFGNGSPDPAAFGGRAGLVSDSSIGSSRLANFMGPEQAYAGRRNTYDADSGVPGARGPGYGGSILGRGSMDAHAFNGGGFAGGPWPNSAGALFDARGEPSFGAYAQGAPALNGFGVMRSNSQDTGLGGMGPAFGGMEYGGLRDMGGASGLALQHGHNQFTPSPTMAYAQAQGGFPQSTSLPLNHQLAPGSASSSPWLRHAAPAEIRRADSASSSNVNSPAISGQAPWSAASVTSSQTDRSGWYAASRGVVEENWGGAGETDGLTNFNVEQHNRQQQQPEPEPSLTSAATAATAPSSAPAEPEPESQQPSPAAASPVAEEPARTAPAPAAAPVKKGKRNQQTTKLSLTTPAPAPKPTEPEAATPPPSAAPKPVWLKEDDKKKAGVTLSLREIQEMEARQAEARKAAEKEQRERAARAAPASGEDAAAFTASWGLPTSQAGGRGSAAPKEAAAGSTASTPGAPTPWVTGAPSHPAKKAMKEILEEEERRKKAAAKESVAAAAARRAYADTTQKSTPPPQQTAWTTVGPSGKTSAPAGQARPTVAQAASTGPPSAAAKVNGASASKPPAPVVRDTTPSSEFLKWLYESLSRGLNASVNAEEIMTMLTTFPVEDISQPATLELIQEVIYANSTTMDGRRFASEFANKRKADVAARAAGTSSAKPVSIADVVKAQPKPTQPEWGGFKVVNKKKKGGRS
ncbi:hypothetical protein HDZ31DRAFT_28466 [Schizophyllum fasciatum]